MVTLSLLVPGCIIGCLRRTHLSFIPCVFLVLPFELFQSHLNYAARFEDPEPLATSGDPGLVLSTGLSLILWSWQARPFLYSLCFMGPTACPFMDFGLQIFWAYHPFPLWWAQPFYHYLPWDWPIVLFIWASVLWFFRPQHLDPRARGLPTTHAWVI